MTKEEVEELRKTALTLRAQKFKQDENDMVACYNAWLAKNILEIEEDIRKRVKIGITEFEYQFLRQGIPEKLEEHWYNVPFTVPRAGTSDIIFHFAALGFKCDYRPGRYVSDVITIKLI